MLQQDPAGARADRCLLPFLLAADSALHIESGCTRLSTSSVPCLVSYISQHSLSEASPPESTASFRRCHLSSPSVLAANRHAIFRAMVLQSQTWPDMHIFAVKSLYPPFAVLGCRHHPFYKYGADTNILLRPWGRWCNQLTGCLSLTTFGFRPLSRSEVGQPFARRLWRPVASLYSVRFVLQMGIMCSWQDYKIYIDIDVLTLLYGPGMLPI